MLRRQPRKSPTIPPALASGRGIMAAASIRRFWVTGGRAIGDWPGSGSEVTAKVAYSRRSKRSPRNRIKYGANGVR